MDKIIVIVGPTGVGKTKMSVELAKRLNGEIINADSTQVYKGLNIATAKATKEEMENIPHYLLDIKDITENYSVYDFQKDCREAIKEIISKNKTPIIVGGTGLYIKAALYDYQFEKEEIKNEFELLSNQEILNKINKIDSNHDIHVNNRKRLIRKLNKLLNNQTDNKSNKLLYDVHFIGLTTDREKLYTQINNRVNKMVELGLLDEAKSIYESKIRTKAIMTPIGYKELFSYFNNENDLDISLELIKQSSRRYAKRQYTWFNNQMDINWFNVNFDDFESTIENVIKFILNN